MIRYSTKGRKQYRKTDAFDLSEDSLCLGKFVEGQSPIQNASDAITNNIEAIPRSGDFAVDLDEELIKYGVTR
jgi:hypothetical protein